MECLRTDVVKGLGVKLLDKVLELMEEEDDYKLKVGTHAQQKRLMLRHHARHICRYTVYTEGLWRVVHLISTLKFVFLITS